MGVNYHWLPLIVSQDSHSFSGFLRHCLSSIKNYQWKSLINVPVNLKVMNGIYFHSSHKNEKE